MPRSIGVAPPQSRPDGLPDTPAGSHREVLTIKVITPLFGGGVEAGMNDPVTLIRGSSIRGHLRFWWRATRGAACANADELKRREGEIWGTTSEPSKVGLSVSIQNLGRSYSCAQFPPHGNFSKFEKDHPPYALFPFQGKKNPGGIEKEPATCTNNITFALSITAPEGLLDDVHSALWAWLNFGGIGSRTRRGCGALYCADYAPTQADAVNADSLRRWYTNKLTEYNITLPNELRRWPTLPPADWLILGPSNNHLAAWSRAVGVMKEFRQGAGIGRDPGQHNHPRRSRWPEPESIRELSNQHRQGQHPRDENIPTNFFPRAEFGMPIIFEIRGEDLKPTLQPATDSTRMSSPVILKPIACVRDNDEPVSCPLIMRLSVAQLESATISGQGLPQLHQVPAGEIRSQLLSAYVNSPLHDRSQSGSALDAFMIYARNSLNPQHGNRQQQNTPRQQQGRRNPQ